MKRLVAVLGVAVSVAGVGRAAISYNTGGSVYTEGFDLLAETGASVAWTNDSTLAGWSLFRQPAPGTALTTYAAGSGSSTTGAFYSFGSSAADRALGGLGSGGAYFGSPSSGNVAGWIVFSITNATGGSLPKFTVTFDGEQWRNGGNSTAHTMVLEYGFGASFETVPTWTAPGGAFNFTGPIATAVAGPLDGNNGANRVAGLGGVINATWANGETLWVRWIENNDSGNDHGLAIDNFSFTAIPEPGPASLIALGGLLAFARRRRATA